METTVYIAKIISIIYISFGLGLFINGNFYKAALTSMVGNAPFLIFGGFVAIVVGMSIITFHDYWGYNLQGVVSFIGLLALVKGILILVIPSKFIGLKKMFESGKFYNMLATGVFIFGCILGY
ncbi:hypothetical protein ACFLRU_07300, partial [Bacteroidota bacterium]